MANVSPRPLIIIAGVGNGSGVGGATAHLFAKEGYRVALIARKAEEMAPLVAELIASGGEAAAFAVGAYTHAAVTALFPTILTHAWPTPAPSALRVAVYNVGFVVRKPFLRVSPANLAGVVDANVHGVFAFARAAVEAFRANALDARGKRGTLVFTGATGSTRGGEITSAFSAGKFALRALSQSLAKEFGKENIHVAHVVIDGPVMTDWAMNNFGDISKDWKENLDVRVDPKGVAMAYLYLVGQDRSAWTWEMDMRPAHEKW
ncbi:NAD-P-binding protein [Epithele typhae]|uniref:NAD-P-binding protein n=1 Tax=Epithele typhae TaxID=378194 RepID=UPI0020085D03|nr:NAD-P-binding protein [Epithele typhae]KAH9915572.1 NAD-P-binding protein [Epithele typhae]